MGSRTKTTEDFLFDALVFFIEFIEKDEDEDDALFLKCAVLLECECDFEMGESGLGLKQPPPADGKPAEAGRLRKLLP